MAQRTTVILTDDVDGSEATETINFGIEGTQYEIDLSTANADKLRAAISIYVDHGRRVGGRRGTTGTAAKSAPSDLVDNTAVRAWARARGLKVSDRGRIKGEIIQQFKDAGN